MLGVVLFPLYDWLATIIDPRLLRVGSTLLSLSIATVFLTLFTSVEVVLEICVCFFSALVIWFLSLFTSFAPANIIFFIDLWLLGGLSLTLVRNLRVSKSAPPSA